MIEYIIIALNVATICLPVLFVALFVFNKITNFPHKVVVETEDGTTEHWMR